LFHLEINSIFSDSVEDCANRKGASRSSGREVDSKANTRVSEVSRFASFANEAIKPKRQIGRKVALAVRNHSIHGEYVALYQSAQSQQSQQSIIDYKDDKTRC